MKLSYNAAYHPVTLLCQCQICGALFGQAPVVKHDAWRVTPQYRGDVKSEVK